MKCMKFNQIAARWYRVEVFRGRTHRVIEPSSLNSSAAKAVARAAAAVLAPLVGVLRSLHKLEGIMIDITK